MEIIYLNKLIDLFEECSNFLSVHNVKWAKYLIKFKEELGKCSSDQEVNDFLNNNEKKIFGGMGSLSDVFISKASGHIAKDFKEANQRLDSYRKRFYSEWVNVQKALKSSKIVNKGDGSIL